MTVVVDILERYLKLNQWRKVAEYMTGNSTIASIGGSGVATEGGQINTLTSGGAVRNILDDGTGAMTIASLATFSGAVIISGNLSLTSALTTSGFRMGATSTQTTTYAMAATDATVMADATSGAFTVTLRSLASPSAIAVVKKIDSSANAVTVAASLGQTIDGAASYSLTTQWQAGIFQHVGTKWYLIGAYP